MKTIYFLLVTLFVCQISMANQTALFDTDPTIPTLSNLSVCDDNTDGYYAFDLTVQNASILAAQSDAVSDYSISYHETLADANNGGTSIPSPNAYYNVYPNSQTIYVRIRNVNTNSFVVGQFQIIVNPIPFAIGPQNIADCDNYGNPFDGIYQLDLTQYASTILNGQSTSLYSVTYFTTQTDANAGVGSIITATNYLASNGQTIWVRVANNATGCYALTTINIHIEPKPNPIINTVNNVNTICVDFTTNQVLRELTLDSGITSTSNYSFEWYEASNPTTVIGTGATYTVDTPAINGTTGNYSVTVTSNSVLGCKTSSVPFSVIQSGPATPVFNTVGYEITNLSGVQSITVDVNGFGTYEYSLDSGIRQVSNVLENVALGQHVIHVYDTEGGLNYSCDPLIIANVIIETSQVDAPDGLNSQSFAPGATLANIVVSGSNIQWYSSANNKTVTATSLPLNTLLVDGTTYYATQTVGGIESVARLPVTVEVALGVPTNEILTLQYVPNPIKSLLTLQSNTILKSVLVYNLLGQKVYEQSFNDTNILVDLSNLSTGNYILKAQGENTQKVIKIVKE